MSDQNHVDRLKKLLSRLHSEREAVWRSRLNSEAKHELALALGEDVTAVCRAIDLLEDMIESEEDEEQAQWVAKPLV